MANIHRKLLLKDNGNLFYSEDKFEFDNVEKSKVRVKPLTVGICSSDIPRCFDKKAYFYPLIIGHEFSVEIIDDPLNKFHKGDKCVVFPLRPCFKCDSCLSYEFNRCSNYSYYGSRVHGGMQSVLDIDRWNLVLLPNNLDSISGSLIEPIAVCLRASKLAKKNQKILFLGGGFLAQILSRIFSNNDNSLSCVDRNEYKKQYFSDQVNFHLNTSNLEDSSFDVIYECCGAPGVLEECIRLTKPEGDIIQMANPSINTNISANVLSKFMRKELKILGTWNSDFRPDNKKLCDWNTSIEMLVNQKINIQELISHKTDLENSKFLLEKINFRRENKEKLQGFNKAIVLI